MKKKKKTEPEISQREALMGVIDRLQIAFDHASSPETKGRIKGKLKAARDKLERLGR